VVVRPKRIRSVVVVAAVAVAIVGERRLRSMMRRAGVSLP
jgi:hypothetical protein